MRSECTNSRGVALRFVLPGVWLWVPSFIVQPVYFPAEGLDFKPYLSESARGESSHTCACQWDYI